jgi:hypothetical protein
MLRYVFKPSNDLTVYEWLEIGRAVGFEITEAAYSQLTRSKRHFEEVEPDTLDLPAHSQVEVEEAKMVEEVVVEEVVPVEVPEVVEEVVSDPVGVQVDPQKDMIEGSKLSRKEKRERKKLAFGDRV